MNGAELGGLVVGGAASIAAIVGVSAQFAEWTELGRLRRRLAAIDEVVKRLESEPGAREVFLAARALTVKGLTRAMARTMANGLGLRVLLNIAILVLCVEAEELYRTVYVGGQPLL